MTSFARRAISRHRVRIALLFFACLGLLASRRWQQLVQPQTWNEDGSVVLPQLMSEGWVTLLEPMNGYLIASSKIISVFSFSVSLAHYPLVSTAITWIFTALVGVAIAIAPTILRGRTLCALAVFLVPTDPEVFGLPLYSFWWAALLLFLVALWDERAPADGWRLGFLMLGGLSSPVVVMVLPILCMRAWRSGQNRREWVVAAVATVLSTLQLMLIVQGSAGTIPPLQSVLESTVPIFLGWFLVGNWMPRPFLLWVAGVLLAALTAVWAFGERETGRAPVLLYLLGGSVALAVARFDPSLLHPSLAGPRYFFLPFVCLYWILVQIVCSSRLTTPRTAAFVLVMSAIVNAAPTWTRKHDDLKWERHIRSCRLFPEYWIPVQYDGRGAMAWRTRYDGAACAAALERDLLVSRSQLERAPTYAYSVRPSGHDWSGSRVRFLGGTIHGTDYYRSKPDGERVLGSYDTGDADTGEIALAMRRGDLLVYRSGPRGENQRLSIKGYESAFLSDLPTSTDWVVLDFSNSRLPKEFVLTISDHGSRWGEWFAVRIPVD
jgi:hypothetical protein